MDPGVHRSLKTKCHFAGHKTPAPLAIIFCLPEETVSRNTIFPYSVCVGMKVFFSFAYSN